MAPLNGRTVLAIALAFGLVTGVSEAALHAIKQQYLGQFVRVGTDIAWMAPVADAGVCVVIALLLIGGSRIWPRLASLPIVVFALTFISALSLLLMYYPLHVVAKVAVAAGVATQTARLAAGRPEQVVRLARRGLVGAACLVVTIALLLRVGHWLTLERHLDRLPPAQAGSPNVLLIVWDTVRARSLSLHGYERRTTPHLEQWARTGAVFDHAISTSPWTLPSHGSMFTGRWAGELSANWEQALGDEYPTLAEVLGHRGYVTAGFVANTFYGGYEHGLARGFARYEDYVVSLPELLMSSSLLGGIANSHSVRNLLGYYDNFPRKNAAAVTDHFLSWQRTNGERPFFAFLNYFDAHESYLPPAPFAEAFGGVTPGGSPSLIQDRRRTLRRDWTTRPPEEIAAEMKLYDGAILYLDDQLNRLLGQLQSRGVLDNTIVILTSDHGEQFGEHGLFLHGNSLYHRLLHVPLMIRFPSRIPGGTRVDSPVTLRDLPATVLDLINPQGAPHPFPGHTLARHWSPPGTRDRDPAASDIARAEVRQALWAVPEFAWYPAARGDMESVTDDAYHYIRNGDGTEELYSLRNDPDERHNVSGRDDMRSTIERYRAYLLGKDRRQASRK